MSRSHQSKFLAEIEKAAVDYGLECVIDQVYGNTGWVTISEEAAYEPIVRFSFQFNSGNNSDQPYASFEGVRDPTRPDPEGKGRSGFSWYLKTPEFPRLIKEVRNTLARYHQAKIDAEFQEKKAQRV